MLIVKMEIETHTIDYYVELLEQIRERTDNETEAVAIMAEIRKDMRMQQIQQRKPSNGATPATEKQIQYMKRLDVEIPDGLTIQNASRLIDEAKDRSDMREALEFPMRIP